MTGGALVREARRRAGLTQAELARRVGTTQSAIARIERGRTEPDMARVVELIRACGLELVPAIRPQEVDDYSVALGNLRLSVDQRARQHAATLRFALEGRAAIAEARRGRT
jgi:transcriptional regulator with XRE-family HTH domain